MRLSANFFLLLLSVSACTPDGRVTYALAWDTERLQHAQDGSQWQVTTDLGHRVRVDAGFLNSHSAELLPCEPAAPELAEVRSLFVRPARATHLPNLNPTAFHSARVESLTDLRTRRTVQPLAGAPAYCEVHYLVARADDASRGLPMEIDLLGKTLYLRGAVLSADGTEVPFEVATASAHGLRVDMTRVTRGAGDVVVRIERRLGALFDGIDFTRAAPRTWTRQMLANLIAGTSITVAIRAGEAS